MKTGAMPRKTIKEAIMMQTGSQKMLMMVKRKRGFVNLSLNQCLFYIKRRETWTKSLIMRKSFISKSELCASSLRRI